MSLGHQTTFIVVGLNWYWCLPLRLTYLTWSTSIDNSWNAIPVHICHNVPYVDPNRSSSGPVKECLQVSRGLSHNSVKHNSSQKLKYICLTKHGEIPYLTCALGHICMDARFLGFVYLGPVAWNRGAQSGTWLAAHGKAAVHRFLCWMGVSRGSNAGQHAFHRCGRLQRLVANQQGSYYNFAKCYMFLEHKTQYLLIHAPFTRIVVFWHIGNVLPMISYCQICCNTATICIEAIFVKYCYRTGSGLL